MVYVVGATSGIGSTIAAFDAGGVTNCSGTPKTCDPLWTAALSGFASGPAVANGVLYVGSGQGRPPAPGYLAAFDAKGVTNCSGIPKTCSSLWVGAATAFDARAPSVDRGVVYLESSLNLDAGRVDAFDAAGTTNCSGNNPKRCTPLWSASTSGLAGVPSLANGIVYTASTIAATTGLTGIVEAFDTMGPPHALRWRAPIGGAVTSSAVANGIVYVASDDHKLYAFDAAGTTKCSGTPRTCAPLWTTDTGGLASSSAVVANGMIYVGSHDAKLYAFGLPQK
jgi:outer membrane protein assembly factor BamB